MKVVGICGRLKHGKDTVAAIMKEQLENMGCHVFIAHMSKPIREMSANKLATLAKIVNPGLDRGTLVSFFYKTCTDQRFKDVPFKDNPYMRDTGMSNGDIMRLSRMDAYTASPRKCMEYIGVKMRHDYGADYWVNKAYSEVPPDTDVVLNPSTRFDNEITDDGILIKVFNPNVEVKSDAVTENSITLTPDFVIQNNYNPETQTGGDDLPELVADMINKIGLNQGSTMGILSSEAMDY